MIALYFQTKTPISFWRRRRLNFIFFIQPSETLSVELIETHSLEHMLINYFRKVLIPLL